MSDFKSLLASAKLPERSVQVCLRGDLRARFDDLERQLKEAREARRTRPARMGETSSDAVEIVAEQDELREEMAAAMVDVTVRALPRAKWHEFRTKHAPDDDADDGDRALGVKLDPFMAEVMPLCIVDPQMDADDWARLNEVLSAGDFDRLFSAVWDVNRSGVDIPKSRLASLVIAESADASK